MAYLQLTEEATTSSSRIFIKILFQELSEGLGLRKLNERLADPNMARGVLKTSTPPTLHLLLRLLRLLLFPSSSSSSLSSPSSSSSSFSSENLSAFTLKMLRSQLGAWTLNLLCLLRESV